MSSNKERVHHAIIRFEEENQDSLVKGISTIQLSQILNLQRSNISAYLNLLVEEGKIYKITGRPVLYGIQKIPKQTDKKNGFEEIIGYDGSLQNIVDLTKAAILYPHAIINLMIIGEPGTGKSYFAHNIYLFAKEQEIISKEAPFIRVNCQNYHGQEEILSEILFSTSENNYFNQAEGGILFIDSVNLLVGKNRERLINFIETRKLRYLDESQEVKNVILLLACNENIPQEIIEYYAQKIMVTVKLPSLHSRPMKEKLSLIQFFSHKKRIRRINLLKSIMKSCVLCCYLIICIM
ncbi:MAG: sigma 54-interacting transcriptional regulator [Coprobacillaceae bacterium]